MTLNASGGANPETPPLTLGEALAILVSEGRLANGSEKQAYGEPAASYLRGLRERAQALYLPENLEAIFNDLPAQRCETQKTFLAENKDFFLAYFLAGPHAANGGNACGNLFRHLNNCFDCFEEFSSVMQHYYQKFRELSPRAGKLSARGAGM